MRSYLKLVVLTGLTGVVACGGKVGDSDGLPDPSLTVGTEGQPMGPQGQPEDPPMLGLHMARGEGRPSGNGGGSSSTLMTSHGGAVMPDSTVTAIFWGTQWSDAAFAGDKITGLDDFYAGLDGSTYSATNTEYTGTNGTVVGTASTYGGHIVDARATGIRRTPRTSDILNEVCAAIGPNAVANGYYPVYTDVPRGSAGYCAWHSYGSCNGVPVQFGFFFSLDGDSGCDPQDTSGLHSQGLAALANVSGHEYSEMVTDPRNGGWYDSSGNENSDKCAWSWPAGAPLLIDLPNGTQWKIQANWSNRAYGNGTNSTGFANRNGEGGCLFTYVPTP
jgi:hypothetical protein